jgi:hypothetical protein
LLPRGRGRLVVVVVLVLFEVDLVEDAGIVRLRVWDETEDGLLDRREGKLVSGLLHEVGYRLGRAVPETLGWG